MPKVSQLSHAERLIMVPAGAVTDAEILSKQSPKGGWDRETLAGWGVPWPPPAGWRARLTGNGAPQHRRSTADVVTISLTPGFKANLEYLMRHLDMSAEEVIRRCVSAMAGQEGMDRA